MPPSYFRFNTEFTIAEMSASVHPPFVFSPYEQRQPSRLLTPCHAIPFRQAICFFPLHFRFFCRYPLPSDSPSIAPVFHLFCRYPLPSVRSISPLSFSASFAAIPSIQFTPRLPHRFFVPFAAIPSGQFTLPLSSAISPFVDIPLSQLGVASNCLRVSSILPQSPILNSRSLAAVTDLQTDSSLTAIVP